MAPKTMATTSGLGSGLGSGNKQQNEKHQHQQTSERENTTSASTTGNPLLPFKSLKSLADILSTYDPAKNVSNPVMTKYERATILGQRIEQLARGSQAFVDVANLGTTKEDVTSELIAERELLERKLPFVIKRTLPNGKPEYWRIKDMIVY